MSATIHRDADRNEYDPVTRTVFLRPDASMYATLHEHAHAEQHNSKALCWRCYWACRNLPLLSYLTTLWIELDAIRRVKRSLWSVCRREAWAGFKSHVFNTPQL